MSVSLRKFHPLYNITITLFLEIFRADKFSHTCSAQNLEIFGFWDLKNLVYGNTNKNPSLGWQISINASSN